VDLGGAIPEVKASLGALLVVTLSWGSGACDVRQPVSRSGDPAAGATPRGGSGGEAGGPGAGASGHGGAGDVCRGDDCPEPLRVVAERAHRLIGAEINPLLAGDPTASAVFAREFDYAVTGHGARWNEVQEGGAATWDWSTMDTLMALADRSGAQMRGHNLAWHSAVPDWAVELEPDAFEAAWRTYVETIVERYRGRIRAWDVINEPLTARGELLSNPYLAALGPDYIAMALGWVHAIDPDARLVVNDFGVAEINEKSDGLYRLVSDLLEQGAPIDEVGFQCHVDARFPPDPDLLRANLQRFGELGVEVGLSEVDVRIAALPGSAEERLWEQARIGYELAYVCATEPACPSMTWWGVTDRYSWIDSMFGADDPLVFDEQSEPKPVHAGVRWGLAGEAWQGPVVECQADCAGRQCGSDGCGGSCGDCQDPEVCAEGACVVPDPACSEPRASAWPPEMEALFDESTGTCVILPCSAADNPCLEVPPTGGQAALTTTASDCPDYVEMYEPGVRVGATLTVPAEFSLNGTCLLREGEVVGALYAGVWASCHREAADNALVTMVMDMDASGVGRGVARAWVTDLPRMSGASECTIEAEVALEPQPPGG